MLPSSERTNYQKKERGGGGLIGEYHAILPGGQMTEEGRN